MSAIDSLFKTLRAQGHKAFMPFITAGDPDLDFTAAVLRQLVARGSSMCELGIPYSDPIADGPVIQASYTRALGGGVRLARIFDMLSRTTPQLDAPVVTMTSYAIVYRLGLEDCVARAKAAGVAGMIVPDLPVEESDRLAAICRREDFSLIQLVTPTTPWDRTGGSPRRRPDSSTMSPSPGSPANARSCPRRSSTTWPSCSLADLPICIGFGISRPEHVRMLAPVADGLIVGSAIVRRMAEAESRGRQAVLAEIGDYAGELIAAMEG